MGPVLEAGSVRARLAFPASFGAYCAIFIASGSPVALYERYRVHMDLTTVDLSLATVTYFVAVVATLLVCGRLSDILGRRPPSLVAVGLGFAGFFALMGVDGLVPLVLGRALQGVACGLASTALASYVVDAAPERPRWLAAAAAAGAPLIGQTVGALGAGVLVQYGPYPFQLSYLVAMGLLVVFAVLIAVARETRPPAPRASRHAVASLRPHVSMPAAARPLMPAAALVFAATWSMGAFYQTFGPTAVAEGLGTDNTVVATVVFAAYMAPNAIGGPLSGRFSPVGAQRFGIVTFAIAAIGLVAGFGTGTTWLVLVASLVAGTAHGLAFTGCLRTLLIQVGPEQRSGFLATVYLIAYCGAALPSLVAGQVSRVVALPTVAAGYAGLAILAAVATVLLTRGVSQSGPARG